jgi:hypothetical protein
MMSLLWFNRLADRIDLVRPRDVMAISHDLSSEIATALLAAKDRSPRELEDLKEILLVIHSTLQRLAEEQHLARAKAQPAVKSATAGSR